MKSVLNKHNVDGDFFSGGFRVKHTLENSVCVYHKDRIISNVAAKNDAVMLNLTKEHICWVLNQQSYVVHAAWWQSIG